eukprot:223676-Rhodomonas_salina.3
MASKKRIFSEDAMDEESDNGDDRQEEETKFLYIELKKYPYNHKRGNTITSGSIPADMAEDMYEMVTAVFAAVPSERLMGLALEEVCVFDDASDPHFNRIQTENEEIFPLPTTHNKVFAQHSTLMYDTRDNAETNNCALAVDLKRDVETVLDALLQKKHADLDAGGVPSTSVERSVDKANAKTISNLVIEMFKEHMFWLDKIKVER